MTLVGGAGLRNFRQAILLFGAEFGNYQLGGSFDFDLSESAIASGGFHGFEIGLIYKGLIHKNLKPRLSYFVQGFNPLFYKNK